MPVDIQMDITKQYVEGENGEFYVEGLAVTDDVDLDSDRFDTTLMPTIAKGLLGKTVFLNHDYKQEVGVVKEAKALPNAVWVKVLVSKTAPNVITKIKEGVLSGFSIGGKALATLKVWHDALKKTIRTFTGFAPIELSIVGMPSNQNARTMGWCFKSAAEKFTKEQKMATPAIPIQQEAGTPITNERTTPEQAVAAALSSSKGTLDEGTPSVPDAVDTPGQDRPKIDASLESSQVQKAGADVLDLPSWVSAMQGFAQKINELKDPRLQFVVEGLTAMQNALELAVQQSGGAAGTTDAGATPGAPAGNPAAAQAAGGDAGAAAASAASPAAGTPADPNKKPFPPVAKDAGAPIDPTAGATTIPSSPDGTKKPPIIIIQAGLKNEKAIDIQKQASRIGLHLLGEEADPTKIVSDIVTKAIKPFADALDAETAARKAAEGENKKLREDLEAVTKSLSDFSSFNKRIENIEKAASGRTSKQPEQPSMTPLRGSIWGGTLGK